MLLDRVVDATITLLGFTVTGPLYLISSFPFDALLGTDYLHNTPYDIHFKSWTISNPFKLHLTPINLFFLETRSDQPQTQEETSKNNPSLLSGGATTYTATEAVPGFPSSTPAAYPATEAAAETTFASTEVAPGLLTTYPATDAVKPTPFLPRTSGDSTTTTATPGQLTTYTATEATKRTPPLSSTSGTYTVTKVVPGSTVITFATPKVTTGNSATSSVTETATLTSPQSNSPNSNATKLLSVPEVNHLTSKTMISRGTLLQDLQCYLPEDDTNDDIDSLLFAPTTDSSTAPTVDWSEINIGEDNSTYLGPEQLEAARALCREFPKVFPDSAIKIGCTDLVLHKINTGNHSPVREKLRHFPAWQRQEIRTQVDEMERDGIIIPITHSEWICNVVLVPKKDGNTRFCIDYKPVNALSIPDSYPLVRIDDCLDAMCGAKYFSSLDLASGYWQIQMDPASVDKTAFITPEGTYAFCRMPFGLTGAPATFCRLMDLVLGGLKFKGVVVYLDDVQIYSKSFEEHLSLLRQVFQRLQSANLKVKTSKCFFFKSQVLFLGHIVDARGISTDPHKVVAITAMATPHDVTTTKSFLGACGHYRRFIQAFSTVAGPLYSLLKKDTAFIWTNCQNASFQELKCRLTTTPILGHFDPTRMLTIETDASTIGLGAVLSQEASPYPEVLAYISRTLSKAEKNYSVTELECIAVIWSVEKLHHYVGGNKQFTVITDHNALVGLMTMKNPRGRLARWVLALRPYRILIRYRPGVDNTMADHLSRYPVRTVNETLTSSDINFHPNNLDDHQSEPTLHDDDPSKPTDVHRTTDLHQEEIVPCFLLQLTQTDKYPFDNTSTPIYIVLAAHDIVQPSPVIQQEQQEDSFCASILTILQGPTNNAKYRHCVLRYVIKGKLLYRMSYQENRLHFQLCIPKVLQIKLLQHAHDECSHQGITRTFARLFAKYFWQGMLRSVADYCCSCETCQMKKSPKQRPSGFLQHMPVSGPFHTVGIDFTGPFVESHKRNRYMIVAVDHHTKWIEIRPVPAQTAAAAAHFFYEQIVMRHGAPRVLISDQGTQFLSELMQKLLNLLGVEHRTTTAYHLQTNGLTERYNGVIKEAISHYTSADQRDWDRLLPSIAFAFNTSTSSTTLYSPFQLVYSREPIYPLDVALGYDGHDFVEDPEEYHNLQGEWLDSIRELAKQRSNLSQDREAPRYNAVHKDAEFANGDLVLLKGPPKYSQEKLRGTTQEKGLTTKLLHIWHGPWRVIARLSDVNYRIQNARRRRTFKIVHVARLKPFQERIDEDINQLSGGKTLPSVPEQMFLTQPILCAASTPTRTEAPPTVRRSARQRANSS